MIVACLGRGALDETVFGRIGSAFETRVMRELSELEQLAGECDVLVVGAGAPEAWKERICTVPAQSFSRMKTVVDQTIADPDETRALAASLSRIGVALVDAPIHCEKADSYPEAAAIFCAGPAAAVEYVRPVLEAACPSVIQFGESGNGHTAHLLVTAIAACVRMTNYECAALGVKNGLSIADMALVLNRSSGANSACERVLPHLGGAQRTTDLPIAGVVRELRLTSRLAMKAGAPILLANLVGDLCQSMANQLGDSATFDDAVASLESAAGIRFASAGAR